MNCIVFNGYCILNFINTYTASFLATSWDGAVTYIILCNPAVMFAAVEEALQVSAIIGLRSGNRATILTGESIMKLLVTLKNIKT